MTLIFICANSTPPKGQAAYERWSLVYFSRPANDVVLKAIADESPIVAEAVAHSPDPNKFYTGQTAAEWFRRRARNRMVKHMTVSRLILSMCDKVSRY